MMAGAGADGIGHDGRIHLELKFEFVTGGQMTLHKADSACWSDAVKKAEAFLRC